MHGITTAEPNFSQQHSRSSLFWLIAMLPVCSLVWVGCTDEVEDNQWDFTEPRGEHAEEQNGSEDDVQGMDCAEGTQADTQFQEIKDDVWNRRLPEHRDGDAWYQATLEIDISSVDSGDWNMEMTQRFCHESEKNKVLVGMRSEHGQNSEDIPERTLSGQPEWIYPASPGVSSEDSHAFVVGCTYLHLEGEEIPMTDVRVELESGRWYETGTDDNLMSPGVMRFAVEDLHHGVDGDPGEGYRSNAVDYKRGELNIELYWPRMHRPDKTLEEAYWNHLHPACKANEISNRYRGHIVEDPDPEKALVVQTVPADFPESVISFFEDLEEQE